MTVDTGTTADAIEFEEAAAEEPLAATAEAVTAAMAAMAVVAPSIRLLL